MRPSLLGTRRLGALTWDALVDVCVHTVTLVIRGQWEFNDDSVQHDKRCYFSLLAEALFLVFRPGKARKRGSASREVLLVLRQQTMT